jgi:hypothetical protein
MGRARFNKRDHVEKMNRLFESRNPRTIISEQLGTNGFGCDLSCIDISDPATDNMVAQGGGPNSIQPYDATTTYAPGDVVCHLDQGTNVTNIFVASAQSGQLVLGGGQYPAPEEFVTAFFYPLTNPNDVYNYYWEPGVITMACGGNATSGTTSGDWWCDPTGQYVSATGSPCLQSTTQPQSYFTGPSIDQQTCEASCGVNQPTDEYVCMGGTIPGNGTCNAHPIGTYQMGDPNVMGVYPDAATCNSMCPGNNNSGGGCMEIKTTVCGNPSSGGQWPCATIDGVVPDQTYLGKVLDAGSSVSSTGAPVYFEIIEINPSTSAQWGVQDFPEVAGGCPVATPGNSTCDFSWTSSCSQTHLQTGGQNSWTNFLTLRETGFDSVGCQHLQNVVNWNTDQLNSGVTGSGAPLNPTQIARKTEKLAWAQCQANECGCSPLDVPPLTGGPTPTGNNSHESFTGTVCNCVGDCSGPSGQIGSGFQAGSATHQCNGQMCTDTGGPNGTGDIGEIFDYDDGSKTLTFTLNSFSTPGIFGVSQTPGVNMPSATCPASPVGPPVDPDLIDPEEPLKKQSVKQKPVNPLFEEFNRMKDMWKY